MARWEPFREIEAVFRELDRALDFGMRSELLWRRASFPGGVARSIPLVDSREERDRKGIKGITEFIPAKWRQAFGRLREDITNALSRWMLGRDRKDEWEGGGDRWLPSTLLSGGPLIDTEETEDEVVVLAELPGFDKDDFKLELTENRLVLRGEKKQAREERNQGYYYSERSFGAFARSITLPCEIIPEEAKAKYKNGFLRITLPKSERAKVKRVKIRVHGSTSSIKGRPNAGFLS